MNQDRQIRLLIPPFFFFASLLVGVLFDGGRWTQLSHCCTKDMLVAIGAAVAASLLPIGFLLSVIAGMVLRTAFLPFNKPYEACLSSEALRLIYKRIGMENEIERTSSRPDGKVSEQLFAAVTFDHGFMEEGIHTWIMRRWSAFNICVTSVVALILAYSVAPLFAISRSRSWTIASVSFIIPLVINAVTAWRGTMRIVEFQARRLKSAELQNTSESYSGFLPPAVPSVGEYLGS